MNASLREVDSIDFESQPDIDYNCQDVFNIMKMFCPSTTNSFALWSVFSRKQSHWKVNEETMKLGLCTCDTLDMEHKEVIIYKIYKISRI